MFDSFRRCYFFPVFCFKSHKQLPSEHSSLQKTNHVARFNYLNWASFCLHIYRRHLEALRIFFGQELSTRGKLMWWWWMFPQLNGNSSSRLPTFTLGFTVHECHFLFFSPNLLKNRGLKRSLFPTGYTQPASFYLTKNRCLVSPCFSLQKIWKSRPVCY